MNKKIALFMALMIFVLSPVSYIRAADGPSDPSVIAAQGVLLGDTATVSGGAVTSDGGLVVSDGGIVVSGGGEVTSGGGGEVETGPVIKRIPTLVIDEPKIYIPVDGEDEILADYEGDDEVDLDYTSFDESIVEVDEDGELYGVTIGKTKVKVSAPETEEWQGVSAKVTVVVTRPYKISLASAKKLTFKIKESDTISVNVSDPHNYGIKPKLQYASTDKKVAKVTKKGKVTAVGAGKCNITVTAADGQVLTVKVTVKKPDNSKVIYLTYDDGPGSQITPELLDVLKEYDAKATFFLVGNQAVNNKKLVKRQKKEGHTIAIHTYTHDYKKIYASADAYIADFNKTEKLIQDLTGQTPKYWRFPGGGNNHYMSSSIRSKVMTELHKRGYKEMDWTAATNDATGVTYTAQEMIDFGISTINSAIKNKKPPVVLMHDWNAKKHTPEVTKAILEHFTKKGYTFKGLDEYDGKEIAFG